VSKDSFHIFERSFDGSSPPTIAKLPQYRFYLIDHRKKFLVSNDVWWAALFYGSVKTMNQKVNGHTADYIKRLARKIKKGAKISHVQALNAAAVQSGFQSWEHFISLGQKPIAAIKSIGSKEQPLGSLKPLGEPLAKLDPYRNLLVAATNALVRRKAISLHGKSGVPAGENGHLFVKLFGHHSVVIWRDISFDELEIAVWWKYNHNLHPQANLTENARENFKSSTPLAEKVNYKKFVGVVVSGWLERRTGNHIQGYGKDSILTHYTRRGEKKNLENMPTQRPKGFKTEGRFYF